MGLSPISTMGFGKFRVSSLNRVPKPPARITTFIDVLLLYFYPIFRDNIIIFITTPCPLTRGVWSFVSNKILNHSAMAYNTVSSA